MCRVYVPSHICSRRSKHSDSLHNPMASGRTLRWVRLWPRTWSGSRTPSEAKPSSSRPRTVPPLDPLRPSGWDGLWGHSGGASGEGVWMQHTAHYKYTIHNTLQVYNTQHTTSIQHTTHYKYTIHNTLQVYNTQHTTSIQYTTHYKYTTHNTLQVYNTQHPTSIQYTTHYKYTLQVYNTHTTSIQHTTHYKYTIHNTLQVYNTQHTTSIQHTTHFKYTTHNTLQVYNTQHLTSIQYTTHYKYTIHNTLQVYNTQHYKYTIHTLHAYVTGLTSHREQNMNLKVILGPDHLAVRALRQQW